MGAQPTVGLDIDLLVMACAVAYEHVFRAQTRQELHSVISGLKRSIAPSLLEIFVHCGARKDLGRPATTPG